MIFYDYISYLRLTEPEIRICLTTWNTEMLDKRGVNFSSFFTNKYILSRKTLCSWS